MKIPLIILSLVSTTLMAFGQQKDKLTLDDLLGAGQQFLQENVDENWLRAFQNFDEQKVQQLLTSFQKRFQGDYVIDLASLKGTAAIVLPLLENHDETKSYASWLRSRMDYLHVADEFRLTIPPPKNEPGQPPKPAPNPTPELQRQVWKRRMEKRPSLKGSESLVPRLKPIFTAQQVPAELVWVAEVESSFDPKARSPVGAAGLFQLMPATAQESGLSLRPEDERFQPEKNARAAAKYLKRLHGQFADWRLALAAYNAGAGRVQSLMQKYQARSFDRIAPHLPAETQMYVPRIEATLARREGITLAQLKSPRHP